MSSKYVDGIIKQLAMSLADDGETLIKKAFMEADYSKDKTQNLHDSYGCAVYYKGGLVAGTMRVLSRMATTPRYNHYSGRKEYGADEITTYLSTYKPSSNRLQLVIAVAMFYGSFLEAGSGNLKRKYRVISGVDKDIDRLAATVRGTVRYHDWRG